MRTTITMDDGLLADAQREAHASGTTLSGLIREVLRERLTRRPESPSPRFELITFGGEGACPGVDLEHVRHLIHGEDDAERFGGRRRGRS